MKSFTLKIVTPTRELFNGEADQACLPGVNGYFGVLADHAPLLAVLDIGVGRFKTEGTERTVSITGGFAEVSENTISVIARSAEFAEEIDEARAETAMRRATERIDAHPDDLDMARAQAALRRAHLRLSLSKSRKPSISSGVDHT